MVVHSFDVSGLNDINFSTVNVASDHVTIALTVRISFSSDIEYDHVPEGGEFPVRERSSINSGMSVNGLLELKRLSENRWGALVFTPEYDAYEMF